MKNLLKKRITWIFVLFIIALMLVACGDTKSVVNNIKKDATDINVVIEGASKYNR